MDDKRPEVIPLEKKEKNLFKVYKFPPILSSIIIILFLISLVGIYTDFLWFKALSYQSVFLKIFFAKISVALAVGGFLFVLIFSNVSVALRPKRKKSLSRKYKAKTTIATVSILIGVFYSGAYLIILKFFNSTSFNIADPIFSKDIAFYVFSFPFFVLLVNFLIFASLLTFLGTAVSYLASKHIQSKNKRKNIGGLALPDSKIEFSKKSKYHLSGIGAFFFVLIAIRYFLERFSILFSTRGIVHGAGYTDVFVSLPIFSFLAALSVITAIVLFIWPARLKKVLAGTIIAFLIIMFTGHIIIPELVQQIKVLPNEIEVERQFIERNIQFTRQAYGLDKVEVKDFEIATTLSKDDLEKNKETLNNIRLWDPRPLKQTYKQLQEIRLYYDFMNVDIDRYTLDGKYTQLMLSPRELDQRQLPDAAKTWVNQHLAYTHGYGLTASSVKQFTKEGLPELLLKDLPPKTSFEALQIDQAQIYYGELANEYIIVKSQFEEFDYPAGDKNVYTRYAGTGGVPIDSYFKRLLMALRFKDFKLLFTSQLAEDSAIMFDRQIQKRVRKIAPFITYDSDPYIVIANGRLFWIIDGYTTTNLYPYSQVHKGINYIRNSVKVVIDAYNGDVTYYIIDRDPIISTYQKIFPKIFKDFSEMPSELQKHIRYPEDLFRIQSQLYAEYHMEDAIVFYNKEDQWDIPNEIYGEGQQIVMKPYYIIMKLPDNDKAEFIIMTPFTPQKKNNMIGWLAGRSDDEYGKLIVFKFPKGELIFGPLQVEARIDQSAEISEQITLWDQRGSAVIRGNLLVIPIDHSLLYIEPLYLLAEKAQLPELKRVIVYYGNKVVMEKDLETAFEKIFGVSKIEAKISKIEEITTIPLIQQAIDYHNQVQKSMQQGDWKGVGIYMDKLQEVLLKLEE